MKRGDTVGVHPDTQIRVLRDGKEVTVRATELVAGDYISPGLGSRFCWQIDAVETVRDGDPGWLIEFTDGTSLCCANGTILAGVAGRELPGSDDQTSLVFKRNVGTYAFDSRRRIAVRLLAGKDTPRNLERLFQQTTHGSRPVKEKVYYFYEQALRFITAQGAKHPAIDTFSAVYVAALDFGENLQLGPVDEALAAVPLPLFHLNDNTPAPQVVSAEVSLGVVSGGWLTVKQCVRLDGNNSGWVRPVFHTRDGSAWKSSSFGGSYNPLAFIANRVNVFMDDPLVNDAIYAKTYTKEPAISHRPPRRPEFHSLADIAERVPSAAEPLSAEAAAAALWSAFAGMRAGNVSVDDVLTRLAERCRESTAAP